MLQIRIASCAKQHCIEHTATFSCFEISQDWVCTPVRRVYETGKVKFGEKVCKRV